MGLSPKLWIYYFLALTHQDKALLVFLLIQGRMGVFLHTLLLASQTSVSREYLKFQQAASLFALKYYGLSLS